MEPQALYGRQLGERRCQWKGCDRLGEYPAPRSRVALRSYYWFCLEHVRLYNTQWNYYAGMNEEEIEADIRFDTVWQRQTWRFGTFSASFHTIHDPIGGLHSGGRRQTAETGPEGRALAVFGLELPVSASQVKARYKHLVKQHHPDMTGGDKRSEERFKEINEAYQILMRFLRA